VSRSKCAKTSIVNDYSLFTLHSFLGNTSKCFSQVIIIIVSDWNQLKLLREAVMSPLYCQNHRIDY
jgi:hypothetical protein